MKKLIESERAFNGWFGKMGKKYGSFQFLTESKFKSFPAVIIYSDQTSLSEKATFKELFIIDVVYQSDFKNDCNCCNDGLCACCGGTGLVEGEHHDDLQACLTCNGKGE